jgi:predicted Rossmann fold flavoprotein
MSINSEYEVIVVGGGPAGMMAAGRAASRGLRVLLLEKNPVLGKKLSITGGGRCNVTNAEFDIRTLLKKYGDAEPFLYAPFAQFGVQSSFDFFEKAGLPLVVEDRKRAFPITQKAPDVTSVMQRYLKEHGVEVRTNSTVRGFEMDGSEISGILTDEGVLKARAYILASGGKSHAETGSTGEGFSWLSSIGHTTHSSNPNLVPLVVKDDWVRNVSGTVLTDARITFTRGTKKLVKQGDILITHFGLSGPTILNSAFEVKALLKDGPVQAYIDLMPKEDEGSVRKQFQTLAEAHGNKTLHNALKAWFSNGVIDAVLGSFDDDVKSMKVHSLPREVRHSVVARIKSIPVTVTSTKGYDWAIVSDGGVDLKEVDTRTMRSRLHLNVYIVGDLLHVNRPSGGYSLQLCWTTGWVAGSSV